MSAELIAVGAELLHFGRRDTNGDWLSGRLQRSGFDLSGRTLVPDDPQRIGEAVRASLARAELVVVTGGLGPTEDDRTREGLAAAVDRPLERDAGRVAELQAAFAARDVRFRPMQARQADRPRGAEWIENPLGTAPGIWLREGARIVVALPGVPAEMRQMFDAGVASRLAELGGRTLARRTLKVGGRRESSVDEQLRDLYDAPNVRVTILTGQEGIELHLLARGRTAADASAVLRPVEQAITRRLGADLYGRDDETLADAVGSALQRAGRTVATAESCTAGMLAAALTAVPGASAWFRGGVVAYSDEMKSRLVGVPVELLARHGAVSRPVAIALAEGVRERCGADHGVGITGIAGPGGGTADKPVGLVHVALADGRRTLHRRVHMIGDRELVRRRTVVFALDRLRRLLRGDPSPEART